MSVAAVISIAGHVQGVGFRAWSVRLAQQFEVTGWVRNLDDGSVQIFAEGSADNLQLYALALRDDHPYASVSEINIRKVTPHGYSDFTVV